MAKTPETPTTPEVTEGQTADPTLGARRLLVVVISFAVGFALSAAGFVVFPALFNKPAVPFDALLPISILNVPLLPLTTLPVGLLFMIWIDYFMGTKIVPD